MTFKADPLYLTNIINNWAVDNGYMMKAAPLKAIPTNVTSTKFIF